MGTTEEDIKQINDVFKNEFYTFENIKRITAIEDENTKIIVDLIYYHTCSRSETLESLYLQKCEIGSLECNPSLLEKIRYLDLKILDIIIGRFLAKREESR